MSTVINGLTGGMPQIGLEPGGFSPTRQGPSLFSEGASVARFEDALRAANAPAPVQFAQVQPVGTISDAVPLTGVSPGSVPAAVETPTSAAERAVRGLELTEQVPGPGQSILDGLGRLRQVFDGQTSNIAAVNQGQVMDAVTLMNLQTEVVRYTVLVDVSSKLAGKSTQALDALMKGQ